LTLLSFFPPGRLSPPLFHTETFPKPETCESAIQNLPFGTGPTLKYAGICLLSFVTVTYPSVKSPPPPLVIFHPVPFSPLKSDPAQFLRFRYPLSASIPPTLWPSLPSRWFPLSLAPRSSPTMPFHFFFRVFLPFLPSMIGVARLLLRIWSFFFFLGRANQSSAGLSRHILPCHIPDRRFFSPPRNVDAISSGFPKSVGFFTFPAVVKAGTRMVFLGGGWFGGGGGGWGCFFLGLGFVVFFCGGGGGWGGGFWVGGGGLLGVLGAGGLGGWGLGWGLGGGGGVPPFLSLLFLFPFDLFHIARLPAPITLR